jgi:MFS family permease
VTSSRFASLRAAFSNRNYAIYTAGNCLSLVGFWMQRIAVSWLAWELSHSEFWVGAVAFAEIVPLILVGPLFGVWADRINRKKMAILLQSMMALQAAVLFLALRTGWFTIGWLFALTLIEGCIHAAYQPVRLALIPNLVRKSDLVAAAAFTAVTFNVARFAGPAVGGLVIVWSSPAWAILLNSITYLFIIGAWFFIELPVHGNKPERKTGVWGDMREGMQYLLQRPPLMALFMLLTLMGVLARPLTYMLSAFVGAVYKAGPETLALFTLMVGAGAVFSGLKLSMDGGTRGLVRSILFNALFSLLSMIGFVATENVTVACVLIFIFGYTITICTVAGQTLVQVRVDDHMRGRVLSLWVAFTRGAPALGVLVLGWLGQHWGLQWPFALAGVICLAGLIWLARLRRDMRGFFEIDTPR